MEILGENGAMGFERQEFEFKNVNLYLKL